MTWRQLTCWEAICDRCGADCDPDDEGVVHFPAADRGPASKEIEEYGWHVLTVLGEEHLICPDCWTNADADQLAKPEIAEAIEVAREAPERWDQDGPDLLGGERL